MLGRVRAVGGLDRKQLRDSRKRVAIHRNGAKRCFKGPHGRMCEPVKRYVVRRPNQDDALNRFDARGQRGKGCGGDLTRIEVGGMRNMIAFGRTLVTGRGARARSRRTSEPS